MVAPGQPENFPFPGGFVPKASSQKDSSCNDTPNISGWAQPSENYSYILKSTVSQDDYPDDACKPYYHETAQVDNLRVNTQIEGPCINGALGTNNTCSQGYGPFFIRSSTLTVSGNLIVTDSITTESTICAAAISSEGTITTPVGKCFKIPHPLKQGKSLVHACLEGPETAVYIRGRLTNSNVIELPDYWTKLVDAESITVSLTQIGYSQDLIVEKIEWGTRVLIKSGNGANVDCYYNVTGTRKDIPPLEVEPDA